MASIPHFEHLDEAETGWQAIDRMVEEVACLARQDCTPETFYAVFLANLLPAMAADYAAVWLLRRGQWERHFTRAEDPSRPPPSTAPGDVQQVAHTGQPLVLSAAQPDAIGDATLFLSPLTDDEQVAGVVEVLRAGGVSGEIREGYCELLSTFCDRAIGFHCRQQLRRLREKQAGWEQFGEFIESIHQRLDLSDVCYAIANEGRRCAGCDRLSVLVQRGGRLRVQAVSGVDLFDSRSDELRHLQRLAGASARTGEPLWFAGDAGDQPAEIEKALQDYVDLAGTRAVAILPLLDPSADRRVRPRPCGALVFERFDGGPYEDDERNAFVAVARHAERALRNALDYADLPVLWLSRLLRFILRGRRVPHLLLALALTALLIAASLIVQVDFEIHCRGQLQPVGRHEIFAPSDGSIELQVDYADRVVQGDVLMVLHNPDLDYEYTRVLGEIQTTQTQLQAVRASSAGRKRGQQDRQEAYQLGAEEERLKEMLRGLERQRDVLQQQRQTLRIVSPIAGRVLTWNVRELLQSRPVKHGQKLMSIVDPDGPWVLEVDVADHDIGHVLAARKHKRVLDVDFFLATDPAAVHRGTVQQVALASETNETLGTSVRVTVDVDSTGLGQARPSADVVAKIHCGRRSVAYVWLRDVIDVIRTRVLF